MSFSFGWKPDPPDHRDFTYSVPFEIAKRLPKSVDLRPAMPAVYDQGRIGSCTANAIAGAIEYQRLRHKQTPDWIPSRLFIYYNERAMEHSIPYDAGAIIRDGVKSAQKQGVVTEGLWPYDDSPADPDTSAFPPGSLATQKPTQTCYSEALKHQIVSYARVTQNLTSIKGALAAGDPVIFGFTVYESFFGPDGQPRMDIDIPDAQDGVLGGHAVVIVGYNDNGHYFTVRNSWGDSVQDGGYFYMTYAYVTDRGLASDFWVIRTVES